MGLIQRTNRDVAGVDEVLCHETPLEILFHTPHSNILSVTLNPFSLMNPRVEFVCLYHEENAVLIKSRICRFKH